MGDEFDDLVQHRIAGLEREVAVMGRDRDEWRETALTLLGKLATRDSESLAQASMKNLGREL